jgi:threonine dehydrogenase-like Zn-dependent dehydrogenase
MGHEGRGYVYVVDPGPWAGDLTAGDKVVLLPHLSCGCCEGRQHATMPACRIANCIGAFWRIRAGL